MPPVNEPAANNVKTEAETKLSLRDKRSEVDQSLEQLRRRREKIDAEIAERQSVVEGHHTDIKTFQDESNRINAALQQALVEKEKVQSRLNHVQGHAGLAAIIVPANNLLGHLGNANSLGQLRNLVEEPEVLNKWLDLYSKFVAASEKRLAELASKIEESNNKIADLLNS